MSLDRERIELLELFYQCPVGLVEIDDDGAVRKVNPAAARMLAPALGDHDLSELFPILRRLAPDLVELIVRHPERVGTLDPGRELLIPYGRAGEARVQLRAVRVQFGRVLIVLIDEPVRPETHAGPALANSRAR